MLRDPWGFSEKPRTIETIQEELRIAKIFMLYDSKCWVDGPERTVALRVISELQEELNNLCAARGRAALASFDC